MIDLKIFILVFLSFGYGFCGGIPQNPPNYDALVKEDCKNKPIIAFNNNDKRSPDYILGPNETPLNDALFYEQRWGGDLEGSEEKLVFRESIFYGEPGIAIYVGSDPGANHCGTKNPVYASSMINSGLSKYAFNVTLCIHSVQGSICQDTVSVFCENVGSSYYSFAADLNLTVPPFSAFCTVPYNNALYYSTDISVSVPTPIEEAGQLKYRFFCEFNVSATDNFWYTVKWYRDGSLIKTYQPIFHSGDIAQNTLLTEDMLGTNSLGFKIQCSYAVSLQVDSELGFERRSPAKFVGIEILTPTIHISDGQQARIKIRSTVPLGCLSTQPNCALMVNIIDPSASQSNPSCDPTSSFSKCVIKIPSDQWNQEFTVTISADPATQYGNKQAVKTISLQTSDNFPSHSIWQNYNVGSVVIRNSQDTSTIQGSSCSATCDPHMRSFGDLRGKRFEHQYGGLFTMYKNTAWEQEIQINTAPCWESGDGPPYCVCGAAVRVGREVFVIDHCAPLKYWKIAYTQCSGTKIALMDITRDGSNYKIKLPSGLVLETRIYTFSKFLNLYLYPSEADVSAVGLCGALGSDLFKKRDGSTVTYQPYPGMPEFSDSWRVTIGMVDLFSDDITTLVDIPTGGYFCKCTTPVGSAEPQFTCEKTADACAVPIGHSQPVAACQVGNFVNKRSAPNNRFVRSIQPQHNIRKRAAPTWRDGWDQAKAEAYCDSIYSNSTLVQKCQQIGANIDLTGPKDNCIRDIEYMADTSFALVYIESIASQCEREVVYNATFHTAAAGQTPLLDQIKEVLCPLDCSYHGVCVKGRCQCNIGWSGVDCSLDLSIVPLLDHVDKSGHCDLFKGQCSDISVFGGDFIDTSTKCRIVAQQLSETGEFNSKTEREESSLVESIGEVKCSLSVSNRKRRSVATKPEEEFVEVYSVSVSNNGAAYSDPSLVVVFNSRCQFCTISNDHVQCYYIGEYCFSGGNCYGKGEPHLVHKSYTCSVNNGVREWIQSEEEEEDDLAWIAGVVIGVLAAVAIVGAIAYCLIKKKKSQVFPPEEPIKGSLPPYSTKMDQKI